jgi:oligopeptide transport system substrate-binding protein
MVLAGCARRLTPVDAGIRDQTILLGNAAEPQDLDPDVIYAYTDSRIAYTLFQGLTWLDPRTNTAVPAVATSWDVTPDGLVYVFHMRPETRWSNGDPVTAEDFVYSFRRILTPDFAATYSYMLWPIKNAEAYNEGKVTDFTKVGVKALGPHTLQVTLEQPTPYLPALASHTTWLPVHRSDIEKFGKIDERNTKWTRPGNLVGNGAFTLEEWSPNSRIIVRKNPLYWDAAHVRLNRIIWYPIEHPDIEDLNYRSGQLDSTYDLPMDRVEAYRKDNPVDIQIDPVLSTFYVIFNVTKPPFNDARVRLALAHAVDRKALSDNITHGVYPPAHTLTPPNCGGYTCRAGISDDFELAKKLLAEAGYPGGRGFPSVEVITYQTEVPNRMLEAIQEMWQARLGIHITIAQQEQKTLFQNSQTGNFSMAFSGWLADYPDPLTFLQLGQTGNGNNWSEYSNKAYDQLIDEASHTPDNAKRLEIFQRAEALMLSETPLIPLYYRSNVYALSPHVRGWATNVVGFQDLTKVWLEK